MFSASFWLFWLFIYLFIGRIFSQTFGFKFGLRFVTLRLPGLDWGQNYVTADLVPSSLAADDHDGDDDDDSGGDALG